MKDVVQTGQVFNVRASGWIEYGGSEGRSASKDAS